MGMILGIDEAGRGCIIGPMMICGVLMDQSVEKALTKMGVKDSKQLSPAKRDSLTSGILSIISKHKLVEVGPSEIDRSVRSSGVNVLEAEKMAEIIAHFKPSIAIVDAPGRGGNYHKLLSHLLPRSVDIMSLNHADEIYPVVSAASILAKVRRDQSIRNLHNKYGDFGSGYTFDKKTIAFLKRWYDKYDTMPPCVRTSWKTVKRIADGMQYPLFKR
jgi:ribonuclease HII